MNRLIRVISITTLIFVAQVLLNAQQDFVNVSGKWQASWQGRLGSEPITLDLKQNGAKLSGKLVRASGTRPLTGTVEGNVISFTVNFTNPKPYMILFKGTIEGDSIKGSSQAQNVGKSGAYLGHGGEIVQPDHPWTATREQRNQQQASKSTQ